MSETNGSKDRLDRLEASHVRLMTEHELFVEEHETLVADQDREWERQKERWASTTPGANRTVRTARRAGRLWTSVSIRLVSGIGEFMRQNRLE